MKSNYLAINGGEKIRNEPMPYRKLFGEEELKIVAEVFKDSWENEVDFGYQGKFEKLYTDKFCEFQGGGFADAVSSGTAGIYLALKALNIEETGEVIVSPVTDPGGVAPIVMQNMKIIIADSHSGSYNVGPEEFEAALTPNTRAAILTHVGGHAIDMEPIVEIADAMGIKIIEDCSQAHGSVYKGKRVGCFGDIAVLSTMFSKAHATGGCGGIVYTQNEEYYWRIRSLADRGKPFNDTFLNPKDPSKYLFPSLNFNLSELDCAIGLSTLSHLQATIEKRLEVAGKIDAALDESQVVSRCEILPDSKPSLFFHTVLVDVDKISVSKKKFAEAIASEGISINPHYMFVVSAWKWIAEYLEKDAVTPNAVDFRDRTFNILFNERFTDKEVEDIIAAIKKVEKVYCKK